MNAVARLWSMVADVGERSDTVSEGSGSSTYYFFSISATANEVFQACPSSVR
jgi:hypothetical protein